MSECKDDPNLYPGIREGSLMHVQLKDMTREELIQALGHTMDLVYDLQTKLLGMMEAIEKWGG